MQPVFWVFLRVHMSITTDFFCDRHVQTIDLRYLPAVLASSLPAKCALEKIEGTVFFGATEVMAGAFIYNGGPPARLPASWSN